MVYCKIWHCDSPRQNSVLRVNNFIPLKCLSCIGILLTLCKHTHTQQGCKCKRHTHTHTHTHTQGVVWCHGFPPCLLPIPGQPFIIHSQIYSYYSLSPVRSLWNHWPPRHSRLLPRDATPTLQPTASSTNSDRSPLSHCLPRANQNASGRNHRGPGIQVWLQR